MEHAKLLWNQTKDLVAKTNKIGKREFDELIAPIEKIHKFVNNYIYIIVPHKLTQMRLDKYYLQILNEALSSITAEKIQFKTITKEEATKENEESKQKSLTNVNISFCYQM